MSSYEERAMGPLEVGRRLYQQKNYKSALEAVDMSTGNLQLTALDYRAATHEKLGNLQPALRDSKQMIDLKPELSKGYLRCAKILQLKGEKDLASKIYERGLTKVKIGTDSDRTILQSMFNKLRRAQDPSKSLDPLQFLPIELAELVVQNLNMRDRVICLRVSRPWKRLLESSHKLWTTFDTTSAQKPVSQHALKTYLRRSNYTLDKAVISSKAQFDAKRWAYLTKTCKKLQNLKINGSGVIGSSLTEALPFVQSLTSINIAANCEITFSAVELILRTCHRTLSEAVFLSVKSSRLPIAWPKLECLRSLEMRTRETLLIPPDIPAAIPNIKQLTLVGGFLNLQIELSLCKSLEQINFIDVGLHAIPILPPTITKLNVSKNPHLSRLENIEEAEAHNFPLLELFDCTHTDLSGELIREITSSSIKNGNLKTLHLGFRLAESVDVPVTEKYPTSKTVEELSLAGSMLREQRIIDIVDLYPKLSKLNVSNTKITGVAVKHFINAGIRWLKLDECSEISPDAVEYARGRGVEVEFNFPSRRQIGFRDRLAF